MGLKQIYVTRHTHAHTRASPISRTEPKIEPPVSPSVKTLLPPGKSAETSITGGGGGGGGGDLLATGPKISVPISPHAKPLLAVGMSALVVLEHVLVLEHESALAQWELQDQDQAPVSQTQRERGSERQLARPSTLNGILDAIHTATDVINSAAMGGASGTRETDPRRTTTSNTTPPTPSNNASPIRREWDEIGLDNLSSHGVQSLLVRL